LIGRITMRLHYVSTPYKHTYLDWVMMGYRVLMDAKIAGYDKDGEPLYSAEDVEKDDEDMA